MQHNLYSSFFSPRPRWVLLRQLAMFDHGTLCRLKAGLEDFNFMVAEGGGSVFGNNTFDDRARNFVIHKDSHAKAVEKLSLTACPT